MAGVGEAASIASLIVVAGQCIDQVSKLYSFGKGYKRAVPQAQEAVDELARLKICLNEVRSLALRAKNLVPDATEAVQNLDISLWGCLETIKEIDEDLQTVSPSKKHHVWAKIKVAARPDYFPLLQTRIASVKQDLMLRLDALSLELDLHTTSNIEHLITSTSSISANMIELKRGLGDYGSTTERHLVALDARMQEMFRILEGKTASPQTSRSMTQHSSTERRPPRKVSRKARYLEIVGSQAWARSSCPRANFMRLVAPALLQYERRNTMHKKIVFIELDELNKLDEAGKINMILYLQSLRMLLWLLRQENYAALNSSKQLTTLRSSLTMQAGITSFWEFCHTFAELTTCLKRALDGSLGRLSWLRAKPWLQYLFNRMSSEQENSAKIIALVLQRWPSFPPPDNGIGKYNLLVAPELLHDPRIKSVWNMHPEPFVRITTPECRAPRGRPRHLLHQSIEATCFRVHLCCDWTSMLCRAPSKTKGLYSPASGLHYPSSCSYPPGDTGKAESLSVSPNMREDQSFDASKEWDPGGSAFNHYSQEKHRIEDYHLSAGANSHVPEHKGNNDADDRPSQRDHCSQTTLTLDQVNKQPPKGFANSKDSPSTSSYDLSSGNDEFDLDAVASESTNSLRAVNFCLWCASDGPAAVPGICDLCAEDIPKFLARHNPSIASTSGMA